MPANKHFRDARVEVVLACWLGQICRKANVTGLQMPDMDGFQVLEMGADDYLLKPFEPEVMISRIRAAFRRAARSPA